MAVTLLYFLYYVILSALLLWYCSKHKLPILWLWLLFAIKCLAGIAYGYIHLHSTYGIHTDTWKFYTESLPATELLKQQPAHFFTYLFGNNYNTQTTYLSTTGNYMHDLKHNILVALMSICNVASGNNYYINTLLYNAFTMIGCIAFYKYIIVYYTSLSKWLILGALCIPSFIFWSSGFHKEGILFTLISVALYASHGIIYKRKYYIYACYFALSIGFIVILRNYVLLFLMPAFTYWVYLQYYPKYGHWLGFMVLHIALIICLFTLSNIPNSIAHSRKEFILLGGATTNDTMVLQPTISSYAVYLPYAINNALLKPSISQLSITYIPSAVENVLLLCLIIFALFHYKKVNTNYTSQLLLYFALGTLLLLGYAVPITGAIIRYKAILLPYIVIAILPFIHVQKIKSLNQNNFN